MGFAGLFSLLLRSSFAIPSLQSRDTNIGFGETDAKQTYLFAAWRAGYRDQAGTDFLRRWRKRDASMERGWYGLGARKVRKKDVSS